MVFFLVSLFSLVLLVLSESTKASVVVVDFLTLNVALFLTTDIDTGNNRDCGNIGMDVANLLEDVFFLAHYNVFNTADFQHAARALDDPLEDQRQIEEAKTNTHLQTRTFKVLRYVLRMFLRVEHRVVDAELLLQPSNQVLRNYRAWNRERNGDILKSEALRRYHFDTDHTKDLEPEKVLDVIAELCDIPD